MNAPGVNWLILAGFVLFFTWLLRLPSLIPFVIRYFASRRWPIADATIQPASVTVLKPTASEIRSPSYYGPHPNFRSILGYSFQVDGKRYAGLFAVLTDVTAEAYGIQSKFAGRVIPVRYDPKDPGISLLADPYCAALEGLWVTQAPYWVDSMPGPEPLQLGRSGK